MEVEMNHSSVRTHCLSIQVLSINYASPGINDTLSTGCYEAEGLL